MTALAEQRPHLELRAVTKSYSDSSGTTDVLRDINLTVAPGEFMAILGFSGSGKTTLVSAIAGLLEVDGEILVNGDAITGPSTERGVVFQSYSLMPWLTVEENVALAVDAVHSDLSSAERGRIVDDTVELVGLTHAKDRRPKELSGGMRQRVAVARALAGKPEILLLDEPLSALDALTRARLQDEIERIRAQESRTIVLITNDVDEALLLADRVAILEPGPAARIAEIVDVDLERPRARTELNNDLAYTELRRRVVKRLDALSSSDGAAGQSNSAALPSLEPVDLTPPKAYLDASATGFTRRYLEFSELTKVYPTPDGPLTVVDAIDLHLVKGEFISLIGHSGCGKSTVLTMTAGLNDITSGWIALDGQYVNAAGPDKAVVFQAPSLFPWLTARDNVALGVERVYPKRRPTNGSRLSTTTSTEWALATPRTSSPRICRMA